MPKFATVAELLADPKRWCQHDSATNDRGRPVVASSPEACRWCLSGAISAVYSQTELELAARSRLKYVVRRQIVEWNDAHGRTHAEVLEAVAKANI